mgnify:CR=1 FL=1
MKNLSQEELKKLADLSGVVLSDDEYKVFAEQLRDVISYTEEITNLELSTELEASRNINVFRDDQVRKRDSSTIIENAPQSDGRYFVVPNILD